VCKKENKNKNKRNPGKIQLARDPTASDDACPPPSSNPGLARLFAAAIGWRAHQGKATASKSRDVNCSLRAALVCCSFSSLSLFHNYILCRDVSWTCTHQVGSTPKFLPFSTPPMSISNMRRASIDGISPCLIFSFLFLRSGRLNHAQSLAIQRFQCFNHLDI
jgi:hypothetical protein